jgi:phage tail sheath protein FI
MTINSYSANTFDVTAGMSALVGVFHPSGGINYGLSGSPTSSITVYGATLRSSQATLSSIAYVVESLYPGAGYNAGTTETGDTSGNSVTIRALGGGNFFLDVNNNGSVIENYKAHLFSSGAFIEDVINTGETNPVSDYIKGNIFSDQADEASVTKLNNFASMVSSLTGQTQIVGAQTAGVFVSVPAGSNFAASRFVKPIAATYSLAGGSNGIPTTEATRATVLIGDASVEPKTGMQSLDNDLLNIGIALVPGVYNQSVQNALITLAENTQNFLALVSPPYGIGTVQDAIDWSNGKSSSTAGSRTSAINSSYAAIYFPHIKVFSTFDGKDRWYDPTIFAARQMAYTDSVSETWFAPAGYVRGRLTKPTDVEVKLNQGDRDTMYSGGNVINPIVNFAQQGITIFGQRTTQRSPSALDRINIRRMMIYIRKIILASTRTLVFEPNDEFTWAKVEGLLNPFFDGIKQRRGITEFKVICDATTNTPERVDKNEMWCRVLIKPTKTAEIVVFELNLTNQSADLGTL